MNPGTAGEIAFPTFCLEYSEHFSPGSTYTATVEPHAIYGGNGGAQGTPPNTYDPVSSATQVLYKKFITGELDMLELGFSFSYTMASSYTALQTALWFLEQENWGGSLDSLGTSLKDWALAEAQAQGNIDYGVRAMNLWAGTPYVEANKRQSQLIWVSVPEPSSLVLLAVSLLAIGAKFGLKQRQ
jgi:hypothetical protein